MGWVGVPNLYPGLGGNHSSYAGWGAPTILWALLF